MKTISREEKYDQMRMSLNEKQWRQYLGGEAKECGNVAEIAREAKVSRNTIKRGMKEIEAGEVYQPGERIRKIGGGRKSRVQTDLTLLADLRNWAFSQRGSHELGPVDLQILIAPSQGASCTGTSHQEIGSGRASASAEVFLTG